LGSNNFGQFFEQVPIDYQASAYLKSMFFLSPYVSELDSIRGVVTIDLSLSGKAKSIIRSGNISISNSSVFTTLLDNPITSVDGNALLKKN
jgi:hypothetical protein